MVSGDADGGEQLDLVDRDHRQMELGVVLVATARPLRRGLVRQGGARYPDLDDATGGRPRDVVDTLFTEKGSVARARVTAAMTRTPPGSAGTVPVSAR
jgi:hypothetical protein